MKNLIQFSSFTEKYSAQDYNRYSYVRNNPLKYTDPSGYIVWPWKKWKNVPMFVSDDSWLKQQREPWLSRAGGDGNNADDGYRLWEYREELRGATGAISGIPGTTLRFLNGNRTTFREKKEFYIQSHKAELISEFGEDVFYSTKIRTRWSFTWDGKTVRKKRSKTGTYYEEYGLRGDGYNSVVYINRRAIKKFWDSPTNQDDLIFHEFVHVFDNYYGYSTWLYIMYGNLYIYIFEYRAYLYQFEKFGTGYEDLIFYSEQRFIMPGYLKY